MVEAERPWKTQRDSWKQIKDESFVFCVIKATIDTLRERFHRHDEKILMLSSWVVCLSFKILNTFENEKGIVKILVNSFVIDIHQIDMIFFAIITTRRSGAMRERCFTRFITYLF